MRPFLLALLALSGLAFAPPHSTLPRGNDVFTLGWSRAQVDSSLAEHGVRPLSGGNDFLTAPGSSPDLEFVEFKFVPAPHGTPLLYKVTYGYRVPYGRDVFESARGTLVADLGAPSEEHRSNPDAGDVVDKITWADPATIVQLGARWTLIQDPAADRMMVTWVDRRLQRVASVQIHKNRGKK
jgi:hypothetical protein